MYAISSGVTLGFTIWLMPIALLSSPYVCKRHSIPTSRATIRTNSSISQKGHFRAKDRAPWIIIMEACKHTDISGCDATCECLCDSCQVQYEAAWAKRAAEKSLCVDCGVPIELTPESLLAEQHTHFFQPCPACTDRFKECMKLAKLCESCHSYTEGECKNTVCGKPT